MIDNQNLNLNQNQNEICCRTTDEGDPYCVTSASGQSCSGSQNLAKRSESTLWQNIRSGAMFGLACITSPCCTPLIVPIILALLAGTPAAVWMSQNLGWVYGGLTLISAISLVLALRWMGKQKAAQPITRRSSDFDVPVSSVLVSVSDKTPIE